MSSSNQPVHKIKAPCIFCGASAGDDPLYEQEAKLLGDFCGKQGWDVVYGGGHIGMMGALANAALDAGGRVTGVIPQFLKEKEIAHSGLTELFVTETMHERQTKMGRLADSFIILPGGIGTLAEFFEVITWRQLGVHDKPVFIINSGGYWDNLLQAVEVIQETGFLRGFYRDIFITVEDVREFIRLIETDKDDHVS